MDDDLKEYRCVKEPQKTTSNYKEPVDRILIAGIVVILWFLVVIFISR